MVKRGREQREKKDEKGGKDTEERIKDGGKQEKRLKRAGYIGQGKKGGRIQRKG